MKAVKLKLALLIGTVNHAIGDVVVLPDSRADELVKEGAAEAHDGGPADVEADNPDFNPLGDYITPAPPADLDAGELAAKLPPGAARKLRSRPARGNRPGETATISIEPGPVEPSASPATTVHLDPEAPAKAEPEAPAKAEGDPAKD